MHRPLSSCEKNLGPLGPLGPRTALGLPMANGSATLMIGTSRCCSESYGIPWSMAWSVAMTGTDLSELPGIFLRPMIQDDSRLSFKRIYISTKIVPYRRKFRSETSDNMGQLKSRGEKSQKRKDQKKEDADARKGRKVAKHCVFPMIWGSGGSKSRLAKAAGAEPAGQMRDEKLHAVVARSTFPSQNVQNTSASDHFWKLRCRKSARRCGAKHISKSKCTKHLSVGPLLEVEMSKKCTPLWREAHFQVKMYKTPQLRTTFGS